jgi:signal transduction histidine kinase/ligand-binding sensor domain-containing protein/DNA-binding response OmpR family regulator
VQDKFYPQSSVIKRLAGRSVASLVSLFCFVSLCLFAQSADSLLDFESRYPTLKREYHFEYFTTEQGLSNNDCQIVLVDAQGYLWIGTMDGLNRFDGHTFTVYRNSPDDSTSISGNVISWLLQDRSRAIWVGTYSNGLNLFDRDQNKFIRCQFDPTDSMHLYDVQDMTIPAMYEDRNGRIWAWMFGSMTKIVRRSYSEDQFVIRYVQYPHRPDSLSVSTSTAPAYYREDSSSSFLITERNQRLTRFDLEEGKYSYTEHDSLVPDVLRGKTLTNVFEDRSGLLWCATPEGVFQYEKQNGHLLHFRNDSTSPLLSATIGSYEDRRGTVWMITEGAGINQYDRGRGCFIRHRYDKNDPNSFRGMLVRPFFAEDSAGNLWIPTWDGGVGLAKFALRARQFKHFLSNSNPGESQQANALLEDHRGSLWVNGGVLSYGFNERVASRSARLKRAAISMCEDSSGFLWIGTEGDGLHRLDPKTGRVTSYHRIFGSSDPDGSDQLHSIALDPTGILWLGTSGGGIDKFDLKTMRYVKNYDHNPADPKSISNNRAMVLHRDHEGVIWVGTEGGGLNRFDPMKEAFSSWRHNPRDSASISGDIVYAIGEDDNNSLWIGTNNGVCRFDKRAGTFKRYYRGSGELSNLVLSIVIDRRGVPWIGYRDNGLARLDPTTGNLKTFTVKDGLPANRFNWNSQSYRRANGEIVMGTDNGILVFHPDSISENTYVPHIVINSFTVFDKAIPFQKAMRHDEPVVLPYDQNFFSFTFASLDLSDPSRNQHACKLEGLEEQWTFLGARRDVRYTNLSPGEYVFRVKGSNSDGVWNEQGTSLKIVIMPPWWKTTWAYVGYGLALVGMLYSIRRSEKNRERLKHQAELAHTRAQSLQELDRLKSRFFANISHELRTPLTLIEGPATQILTGDGKVDPKENAGIIVRNTQRLLTLVGQLLDLSKLESGQSGLRVRRVNIVEVTKGIAASFESMAARKGIRLSLELGEEPIIGSFDRDAIEKIITNLLSNAFKFTAEGGEVTVALEKHSVGPRESEIMECSIRVSDTGIGILPEHLDKIFDRFYQIDASTTREQEGTGIGLSLTKELVELHHGRIVVGSEVGRGTSFTVLLPVVNDDQATEEIVSEEISERGGHAPAFFEQPDKGRSIDQAELYSDIDLPVILIVEDNADMRQYIRRSVGDFYRVIEAKDGEEGMARATGTIPDLIISDVMMPKIEGFELCRRLKTDERTSHVPIILLTAKAGMEHKVAGLATGADDYLVKPFDSKELLARVKNLIEVRRRLREKFEKQKVLKPGEVAVTSMDDAFLHKAMAVVQERMGDEDFSVEQFSNGMNMSRVQLHRKLKALLNQPAGEFVRYMRLHRGMSLLQQNAGTIAEVAYMVGFGSPAYFTKCFHEQFGFPPGDVRKRGNAE